MWYEYDRKQLGTLEKDSRLEWLMTNGLGGYVFHPVKGEMFRGHHGLLVASLNPPVNRYMCLMNIETSLIMNSVETEITSSSQSLQRFVYDGVVYYEHLIEGVTVNYRIAPFYKHNAVAIEYSVSALDFPVSLVLKPWFNYREHNDKHDFTAFDCNVEIQDKEIRIITLEQDALQTCLTFSCGEVFKNADEQTEKLAYALDKVNGDPRCESHYRPLKIVVEVNPHETKKIGIVASLGEDV
ncbi:MAG: glycogen debranching enzyme N-terminal domain-containing protein, partial [Bacilli bacterium]|nr:glycogen debranching enzyme N-terminal domain-containing protein [Bacilli bacterium]